MPNTKKNIIITKTRLSKQGTDKIKEFMTTLSPSFRDINPIDITAFNTQWT